MIRINEAYKEEMPSWIKSGLDKIKESDRRYLSKWIGLGDVSDFHEEYAPVSNRDKRLKDPRRINFFELDNGRAFSVYFENTWYGYRPATWKDIADRTTRYAWIDIDETNKATDKRADRIDRKSGAIALDRVLNAWQGNRDKSGYIIDRFKYKRILSTRSLDKYQRYLDDVNLAIREVKEAITNYITNVENATKLDKLSYSKTRSYNNNSKYSYATQEGALIDLKKMLRFATDLNEFIKNINDGRNNYDYMIQDVETYASKAREMADKIISDLS